MVAKSFKKMILAVDDNPRYLELMGVQLAEEGYRLVAVQSGEECLKAIDVEKPGLVLLDILMPDMNGLETLKRIKKIDPDIPVAMVTAVWDDEEGKRCFEAGAFEYITKPIDMNHFNTAVLSRFFLADE